MAQPVQDLRALLEERFPDALPVRYGSGEGVATGVQALDAVLPSGGLPRGRLTTWAVGGGATALLRAACRAVVARGERAAWVDGHGTVAGAAWHAGPALFRPGEGKAALECAEVLLRSGGFALIVLASAPPGEAEMVRLSRAAREGGAALVLLEGGAPGGERPGGSAPATRTSAATATAALQVTSRTPAEAFQWRVGPFGPAQVSAVTVQLRVRALGMERRAQVALDIAHHEHRLSLEPGLRDRRGAPGPR